MSAYDGNVHGTHDFLPQGCILLHQWLFPLLHPVLWISELLVALLMGLSSRHCYVTVYLPVLQHWAVLEYNCWPAQSHTVIHSSESSPTSSKPHSTLTAGSSLGLTSYPCKQVDPAPHSCRLARLPSIWPTSLEQNAPLLEQKWISHTDWNLVARWQKGGEPLF